MRAFVRSVKSLGEPKIKMLILDVLKSNTRARLLAIVGAVNIFYGMYGLIHVDLV